MTRSPPLFSPIRHARCWLGLALPKLQLLERKRVRIEGPFLDCMLLMVIISKCNLLLHSVGSLR